MHRRLHSPLHRRLHHRRITLAGVRGGSGTSKIAAALALVSRTMVHTELVAADSPLSAALLGVAPPDQLPTEIAPRLVLGHEASGGAELTVIDAGTPTEPSVRPRAAGERGLGALQGPCYLALRTLLAGHLGLDGLVLVAEPGRALAERDVTDVTGPDVVATVPATPGIALTIVAGLFATRHPRQREFSDLRRWLTTQLDPFPPHQPPKRATAPTQLEMSGTDLPVALCAPGGAVVGAVAGPLHVASDRRRRLPQVWRSHRCRQSRRRLRVRSSPSTTPRYGLP